MQCVNPLQAKCTFANATGARLELFGNDSTGLLAEYRPPPIMEPGAVASFLVNGDVLFGLRCNIQVFQGPGAPAPVGGWVPGEKSKTVILGLNPATNQSKEIDAFVQVIGPSPGPPAMYPTKFTFDVIENGDLVQIFAKQLIDQNPR